MDVTHRSLPVLLTIVLLIFSSSGTSGEASINAPQQVKGVVGRQVSFPVKVPPGKQVEKIEWDVISPASGTPYRLCEFRDGKMKKADFTAWLPVVMKKIYELGMRVHENVTIRALQYRRIEEERGFVTNAMVEYMFGDRLKMAGRTTLQIRKMEKEDAAIYKARVWFDAEQFEDQLFNVTLYDPAPAPEIRYYDLIKTPGGCSVTLRCQAAGAGEYDISWGKETALDNLSLSDNGRNLHVSWRKDSVPFTFTCLVRNPADQKQASFNLLEICQDDEGQSHKGSIGQNTPWPLILIIVVPTFLCVLLLACVFCMKKKSKQRNRDIPSVALEEMEFRPPPENPMMNIPVTISAPESTSMSPPSYDEVQVDRNGDEGTLCSEPPDYDSLFDCTASDPVTSDYS